MSPADERLRDAARRQLRRLVELLDVDEILRLLVAGHRLRVQQDSDTEREAA